MSRLVLRLLAGARRTSTSGGLGTSTSVGLAPAKVSGVVKVAVAVALVLCALPPATNVSPGQSGYILVLVVLTGVTLWAVHERDRPSALTRGERAALVGFFGWLTVSIPRAGHMWDTALAATLLAAIALAAPWAMARVSAPESPAQVTVLVLAGAVVGSAVAAWIVPLVLLQGISWRQALPIGGASNNVVGLTLALAGTITGARLWPHQRWVWRGLALVTGLLIVQGLSRAGWVLALALFVVALASHRHWNLRWGVPVGALLVVAAVVELARRRGGRFLVDAARWDNAANGLDAWSGSVGSVLFGLGPMRLWPWLALERGRPGEQVIGSLLHDSPWGQVLYHAHSTYLEVLVEYGLVGLALLVAALGVVVRRCLREIRQGGELSLVAVALLLALPAMLVELYLLRGFPSAALFWMAALAVGPPGGVGRCGSGGLAARALGDACAPGYIE